MTLLAQTLLISYLKSDFASERIKNVENKSVKQKQDLRIQGHIQLYQIVFFLNSYSDSDATRRLISTRAFEPRLQIPKRTILRRAMTALLEEKNLDHNV